MLNCLKKVLLMLALTTATAHAGTPTIATMREGNPIYYMALAMAKAAQEVTPLDLRPKPFRSTDQGAVFVNRGEVDFGLTNAITLREAYNGKQFFKDNRLENLRAVARLVPLQSTLCVGGDSDVHSIKDMRGKRFPAGFDSTKFGERLNEAMIGTGGLSYNDVEKVKVAGWHEMEMAFRRGEIDVVNGVVGSPTQVTNAQIVKGMRCISLDTGPKIAEHMKEILPDMRFGVVDPAPGLAGIIEPTVVLEFDFWVFANKDTSSEEVTELLTGLLKGKETMIGVSKSFRKFDPSAMHGDVGVPFHPAAEAFFAANKDVIK